MGSSRLKSRRRQDLGSKWARVVIAVLSTVGVIDTGSITLNKWGFIGNLNCPGGLGGCDKVLNSPWGTFFQTNNFSTPIVHVDGFLDVWNVQSPIINYDEVGFFFKLTN